MDKEVYPSDSDESDEDYKPYGVESASEPESDKDELQDDDDDNANTNDEKIGKYTKQRKHKKNRIIAEKGKRLELNVVEPVDEEEEKKRADAVWENFLNDTNTEVGKEKKSIDARSKTTNIEKESPKTDRCPMKCPEKILVTEIYEFAGEKIKVDKVVDKTVSNGNISSRAQTSDGTVKKLPIPCTGFSKKRPSGGLGTVLGQINKKNKLSVLEKTKLDWDSFKQNEGISEELQTFNKGKDGYLQKQDFLEQTDLRQFEIERNLRQKRRSNR